MNILPSEILEYIIVRLNYNIVIRVCKKWKYIAEKNKIKFETLNVDLSKVKDEKKLIYFNPKILNVTCSSFYNNLEIFNDENNNILFKYISLFYDLKKNDEKYNNQINLILNNFKKYTNLKTINICLDIYVKKNI